MSINTKRTKRAVFAVKPNDWAWIHFKVALGLLVPLLAFLTPPTAVANGGVKAITLIILLTLMMSGSILSILGIVMRSNNMHPLIVGYALELGGLIMSIMGPLGMCLVYAYTGIQGTTSFLPAGFCYALVAVLAARGIDLWYDTLESREADQPLGD